jgi:hypothetical protein
MTYKKLPRHSSHGEMQSSFLFFEALSYAIGTEADSLRVGGNFNKTNWLGGPCLSLIK